LFGVSSFTIAAFTLRFAVAAYYFKYYADPLAVRRWGTFEGGALSLFLTSGTVASLLGVIAFGFFAKSVDKKKLYIVLVLAAGAVSVNFAYVDRTNILGMILTQSLFAFLTGPTAAVLFAMYTDIASHIRNETGIASNGLVMAAGSFAQKFGWAISGAITGILLGRAGYVPDQQQSERVKDVMCFIMSWAPTIACGIGGCFMMLYPLNGRRMRNVTNELESKRLATTLEAVS
jgi:GPH family glycoside/pentoside/hexuronide:cation symporter